MPADRLLGQHLQTLESNDPVDLPRVYATATHLLTTLTNPLNLTLLTHHILTSNALWSSPHLDRDLHHTLRVISVFQSAAARILRHEDEQREREEKGLPRPPLYPGQPPIGGNLSRQEWVRSIMKGADERSPAAHHVLLFSGLLIGLCAQDRNGVGGRLRATLENALVRSVNLALESVGGSDELVAGSIALALNYSFELLSDLERARLNYNALLPVLLGSTLFSSGGYQSARYLEGVNDDLVWSSVGGQRRLSWPDHTPTFTRLREMSQQPLVGTMGPLSRLIAHTLSNVSKPWLVQTAMDDLVAFARTLEEQWRGCGLSQVDAAQENMMLEQQTASNTLPLLWRIFRSTLFAVTIILRGVIDRLLNDPALANDEVAPIIATQTLHILRHLYFVLTHHSTPSSFSQHAFVNLTALDIISAHPTAAHTFLTSIQPATAVPSHPHDLTYILYFLNASEHLTLTLSPKLNQSLVLPIATAFLAPTPELAHHQLATPIFEAAHSVYLSVLSVPHNAHIAEQQLPFYAEQVLRLFPASISPRQFRLALKTLVRIASPPGPLAVGGADISATLLELLRHQAVSPGTWEAQRTAPYSPPNPQQGTLSDPSTEKSSPPATLVLTLIDCLPALSTDLLLEWLPLVAELVSHSGINYEHGERAQCRARFWECISGGEMDVERAGICVMWWGTQGGRELVLGYDIPGDAEPMMSGALAPPPESKL